MNWLKKVNDPVMRVYELCEAANNTITVHDFASRKPTKPVTDFIIGEDDINIANFPEAIISLINGYELPSSCVCFDGAYLTRNSFYGFVAQACDRGGKHFQIGHSLLNPPVITWDDFKHYHIPLEDGALDVKRISYKGLLVIGSPQIQTGRYLSEESWIEVCKACINQETRVVCNASYLSLFNDVPKLSQVAVDFPKLQWCEAHLTEAIMGDPWYLASLCGSKDFIGDFIKVRKMHGMLNIFDQLPLTVMRFLKSEPLGRLNDLYQKRIEALKRILKQAGLSIIGSSPACVSVELPNFVFGNKVLSAEHYNCKMIEKLGIAGLPAKNAISYYVFNVEVEKEEVENTLVNLLSSANISYDPQ